MASIHMLSMLITGVQLSLVLGATTVENITSEIGNITSPNYPGNFNNKQRTKWIFNDIGPEQYLVLRIAHIEMEIPPKSYCQGDIMVNGHNVCLFKEGTCLVLAPTLATCAPLMESHTGCRQIVVFHNVTSPTVELIPHIVNFKKPRKLKIEFEYSNCSNSYTEYTEYTTHTATTAAQPTASTQKAVLAEKELFIALTVVFSLLFAVTALAFAIIVIRNFNKTEASDSNDEAADFRNNDTTEERSNGEIYDAVTFDNYAYDNEVDTYGGEVYSSVKPRDHTAGSFADYYENYPVRQVVENELYAM